MLSSKPTPMLRRFPSGKGYYSFDESIVLSGAFLPTSGDSDGVSLFALSASNGADNRATPQALLEASNSGQVRTNGGVVSVNDDDIDAIDGVALDSTHSDEFSDHYIIEAMSKTRYDSKEKNEEGVRIGRRQIKKYADILANSLSLVIHIHPNNSEL